jgi:hypothetical protein
MDKGVGALMKTGKDLGVFGGLLALILGFFFISAGLSLLRYGDYPPPRLNSEEGGPVSEPHEAAEIIIIVAGTVCMAGGAVGFTGGCLADTSPDKAGAIMVTAGCLTAVTVIGGLSSAVLATGAIRAFKFADAPPGTEPEWEDGDALPY